MGIFKKMMQLMPANHSITNYVITILIHSAKMRFQNLCITLLHYGNIKIRDRIAKDVTWSLLSWHKRYDFNAANF